MQNTHSPTISAPDTTSALSAPDTSAIQRTTRVSAPDPYYQIRKMPGGMPAGIAAIIRLLKRNTFPTVYLVPRDRSRTGCFRAYLLLAMDLDPNDTTIKDVTELGSVLGDLWDEERRLIVIDNWHPEHDPHTISTALSAACGFDIRARTAFTPDVFPNSRNAQRK